MSSIVSSHLKIVATNSLIYSHAGGGDILLFSEVVG